MELSIHDLVWKYGKRKETKKYGVTYELFTYGHKKHVYPLVCDCKGVYREIKKVIIRNLEQCQRIGHVWIVDSNGKVYSFLAFPH